jgi:hypothetical protein
MIYYVRSHKSQIKRCSFLEVIITLSNDVFNDLVFDMALDIRKLGIRTRETAENRDTVMQIVGS